MGFLTSCWLSLCPHSQLPTHTQLLQKCCIMKHSPFQGFHPLTVEARKEKVPQQRRIGLFPGACSKPEHCLQKSNVRPGRLWQMVLAIGGCQLLVQQSSQQKYVHAHTHSLSSTHYGLVTVSHSVMLNHLLGRDQQSNNCTKLNAYKPPCHPLGCGTLQCYKRSYMSLSSCS